MADTYIRLSTKLIRQRFGKLSGTAVQVLCILLTFRNSRTKLCCPSESTIADVLGASKSTVKRAIAELVANCIITIERGKNNAYAINPDYAKHETQKGSKMSHCDWCPVRRKGVKNEPSKGSNLTP